MYRAKLGPHGQEVAVKTLKGKGENACLRICDNTHLLARSLDKQRVDNVCNQHEIACVYILFLFPAGDFDDVDVNQFVEESLKMSRFKHGHVMGLIGVCLDAGSAPYIVMPYMANGSLLRYLKKERINIVFSEDADEDDVGSSVHF